MAVYNGNYHYHIILNNCHYKYNACKKNTHINYFHWTEYNPLFVTLKTPERRASKKWQNSFQTGDEKFCHCEELDFFFLQRLTICCVNSKPNILTNRTLHFDLTATIQLHRLLCLVTVLVFMSGALARLCPKFKGTSATRRWPSYGKSSWIWKFQRHKTNRFPLGGQLFLLQLTVFMTCD